jgi:hypothetical protein
MSLTLKFDEASYRNSMNTLVKELKADGVLLLKEEMRLLLRDIVKFTPPLKGHAQGRNAVVGDLNKNARPLDPAKIEMPRLAQVVRDRNAPAIVAITKNLKGGWGGRRVLSTQAEIAAKHVRNRNNYGRVRRDQGNMAHLSDWLGYLKTVQSRVGYHRAGWLTAANAVGLRLPAWVSKHRRYAKGGYVPPSANSLTIISSNRSIKIPNYFERHVYPAVRSRVRSIESELRRLIAGGKSRRGSLAGTPTGQAD